MHYVVPTFVLRLADAPYHGRRWGDVEELVPTFFTSELYEMEQDAEQTVKLIREEL